MNAGNLNSVDNKVVLTPWPPQTGKITCFGKEFDSRQVFHLINFTDATTLQWQDNSGIQAKPGLIEDFEVKFTSTRDAKKVWFASPDIEGGASRELAFKQDGLKLSFKVPSVEYWSMIVVDY